MADFVFVAALRWIDAAAAMRLREQRTADIIACAASSLLSPALRQDLYCHFEPAKRGRVIPMHTAKPYNFLIARVVVVVPKASESTWAFSDNRAPSGIIKHGACLV